MSSYSFGTEYGTDEINVGTDEIRDYLKTNDSNNLENINAIRDRETRLLKKIQHYQVSCEKDKNNNAKVDFCSPNVNLKNGYNEIKRDIINDIENHYFSGKRLNLNKCIKEKTKNRREGFQFVDKKQDIYDMEYLKQEMSELEKKNNILLLFIFFLVIIILIQYSNINNDRNSVQLLLLPSNQTLQN